MDEADHALAAGLLRHLQAQDAAVTAVEDLRPVTTGASQEIWMFTASGGATRRSLVLRRARRWSESGQAASAGMAAEAALLRAAAHAGVPVPTVYSELAPDEGLGEGYLMDRVEGETAGRRILRDASFAAVRPGLLDQCAGILARIHAVAQERLPGLRTGYARDELLHWHRAYEANGVARPVFALALRWLREHAPESVPPALVHGDFRNGNLVAAPEEGVRAVLDWELAHVGDPMEDLGWFCVNAWRFGQVDCPAGGFGTREALFAAYEAAGGVPVEAERVHYWEVLGNLKWGIACDAMALAWRRGEDPSIERLAIGRRATEVEADLLQLLAPQGTRA